MMQFWGVEVKNGSTLKVQPGEDQVVHLSQACLGDVKKDKENEVIRLFVQKNGQKFVIGMLSLAKFPHINLDLIFEDDFELSHDWKHGSVHFAGYKADNLHSIPDEDMSDDDLDEPVPIDALNNGESETKESKSTGDKTSAGSKSENTEGKPKVRIVEPPKAVKKSKDEDDTDEDDDEDDDDEDGEEEDEEMADESGSDDDDSDEEESDEDTQKKKPETSKKRPLESVSTPSVPDKKAKFSTPQKKSSDGKKVSDHVATLYPAKHAGKTPANAERTQINEKLPSIQLLNEFHEYTLRNNKLLQLQILLLLNNFKKNNGKDNWSVKYVKHELNQWWDIPVKSEAKLDAALAQYSQQSHPQQTQSSPTQDEA